VSAVGIAGADLAASERFYRAVPCVTRVEPSHADAGLVAWDDRAIGPTDGPAGRDVRAPRRLRAPRFLAPSLMLAGGGAGP
jgi:hypothetical protein